jgi:transposase-like protein
MKGLTTRDIEDIFADHFGGKYSKSGISRIATEFTETRNQWLSRSLDSDWYIILALSQNEWVIVLC